MPDLDILRRRMCQNEKALVQVLVLLDDVVRFGSSHVTAQAAEMVRTIGMTVPRFDGRFCYAARALLWCAASYSIRLM
jgi:hypothetical protein